MQACCNTSTRQKQHSLLSGMQTTCPKQCTTIQVCQDYPHMRSTEASCVSNGKVLLAEQLDALNKLHAWLLRAHKAVRLPAAL